AGAADAAASSSSGQPPQRVSLKIKIPRVALESAAAAAAAAAVNAAAAAARQRSKQNGGGGGSGKGAMSKGPPPPQEPPSPGLSRIFGRTGSNGSGCCSSGVCGGDGGGGCPEANALYLSALTAATPEQLVMHVQALRMDFLARSLRALLNRLMKSTANRNDTFNTPVDHVALNLPTYREVVTEPMDLGTIKGRLQELQYRTHESFAADVRLTFANAVRFNPATHSVHQAAKMLLTEFESEYGKLTARLERDSQRRSEHDCSLCQGQTCMLCGDKCLRLEPPVLICHGQCNQRIKRDGMFYITRDGSRLWCQKCYQALPPHIFLEDDDDDAVEDAAAATATAESAAVAAAGAGAAASVGSDGGGFAAVENGAAVTVADAAAAVAAASAGTEPAAEMTKGAAEELRRCASWGPPPPPPLLKGGGAASGSGGCSRKGGCSESSGDACSGGGGGCNSGGCGGGAPRKAGLRKKNLLRRRFDEEISEAWVQCDGCHGWVHQICACFNARANVGEARFVCPLCRLREVAPKLRKADELAGRAAATAAAADAAEAWAAAARDRAAADMARAKIAPSYAAAAAAVATAQASAAAAGRLAPPAEPSEAEAAAGASQQPPWAVAMAAPPLPPPLPRTQAVAEAETAAMAAATARADAAAAAAQLAELSNARAAAAQEGLQGLPAELRESAKVYSARELPHTPASCYIEGRVRRLLRAMELGDVADTIFIRCISNVSCTYDVASIIRRAFDGGHVGGGGGGGNEVPAQVQYQSKAIVMFQSVDGADVCLFSVYVQEYGADAPLCNARRVYVAYLDSVEYFRPRRARTPVYHEILVSYFDWVRRRGFRTAHIWSCPPQRGNNFIFWCHPAHQRTPTRERLVDWYQTMLRRAQSLGGEFWIDEVLRLHKLVERKSDADFVAEHLSPADLCRAALDELMADARAGPFLAPVDVVADRCPDYLDIVKTPMDLGTVRRRLDAGEYLHAAAFADDVRLVFSNAVAYNPPKHSVHLAARALAAAFAKATQRLLRAAKDRLGGRAVSLREVSLAEEFEEVGVVCTDLACDHTACGAGAGAAAGAAGSLGGTGIGGGGVSLGGLYLGGSSTGTGGRPFGGGFFALGGAKSGVGGGGGSGDGAAAAAAAACGPDDKQAPFARPLLRRLSRSGSFAGFHGAESMAALRRRDSIVSLGAGGHNGAGRHGGGSASVGTGAGGSTRGLIARMNSDGSDAFSMSSAFDGGGAGGGAGGGRACHGGGDDGDVSGDEERGERYCSSAADFDDGIPSAAAARSGGFGGGGGSYGGGGATAASSSRGHGAASVDGSSSCASGGGVGGGRGDRGGSGGQRSRGSGGSAGGGPGGGDGSGGGGDSSSQTVRGNKLKWVLSQLCKSVDRMKRDLLVVSLAPPDAAVDAEWDAGADFEPGVALTPDCADPEPHVSQPLVDSRHTFLEMCQLRHYQFDTLRRAKHSSAMVLYHLHRPESRSLDPMCSNCGAAARGVRWHCGTCTDYDLCQRCEPRALRLHEHPLTPYRVTFSTTDAD
ncbi:unnamed protein product, partial [Phaeothamnion confervicola]